MKYAIRIVLLLAAFAPRHSAAADETELFAKLDDALTAAITFTQGQSSGPLQEIEKTVFTLPPDSPLRTTLEQKLIDALQAATTSDGKSFLCRQLRVIGTAKSIPALANLLTNPDVSHMARYALGRLEAPAASAALHRALGATSGKLQAGIINTLADRDCHEARADFVKLLGSSDTVVVQAAARALGRLGGTDAVAALESARGGAPAAVGVEIDNALLDCAGRFAAQGEKAAAAELYESFYDSGQSQHVKFAGLRGLIATRDDQAAKTLVHAIQQEDHALSRFAIGLIGMAKGQPATEAFVNLLDSLPPERMVLLLRALGARGDSSAAGAIIAAAKNEDQTVRVAALAALGHVGSALAVPTLIEAAASGDGDASTVARASLTLLSDSDVDPKLVQSLNNDDTNVRLEAIRALARRQTTAAVAPLLKSAADADATVRREAIRALGDLADEARFPAIIQLAVKPTAADDRSVIVDALGKAFLRTHDKDACAAMVLAELGRAARDSKPTLVRVLGKTGAPAALRTVRTATGDADSAVKDAAVRALSEWPDNAASEDLLQLLTATSDPTHKELALQGYLRMANRANDPAMMYLAALKHVERTNDKKAVLEGLGLTSQSPDAIALALQYLDDRNLQAAAGIAVLRIAYQLRQRDEQLARSSLNKVLDKVDHPDVQRRAKEVLNELDKYQDHILDWLGAGPFTEKGKDGAAIYAMVFEPEKDPAAVTWKPITKGIGSWEINLEGTYGGLDFCAAYLKTRVWSGVEQQALLEMGSDDGIKVWLNGKLVFDRWAEHGAEPRQERAPVKLLEGWNDLMLKVVDQQGGWVGACRIRKPDGSALEGLKIEAK